ncbi:hypothetical protein IGI04_023861 [Brassica rapa subsp. trilocularis]|uniref:Uncharacterized protein n=1 Tax=Brassica rapa subsp. trilocularis TaxID=1813537 RepID=A0ABQ7M784_BRACM|nr:hypothetical protein IGI04_023861 [Brassica rapa subsp. trilocularis]
MQKSHGRSLRSDRSVTSWPLLGRSLRSDRPTHSFGRYVVIDLSRILSLRSDRTISNINQRVQPKTLHSRQFFNASSRVPQPYHFTLPSIGVITYTLR